jgi:acetyltransferase
MTIRNLDRLLRPGSVAVIGASARSRSAGAVVLDNIVKRGFAGPIYAVNPHPVLRSGVRWLPSMEILPYAPDLAIVMTPATTVPGIIDELGRLGTKCAVVITAGITEENGLKQKMLDAAKPHLLRIIGPNCLGLMAPRSMLDATFARTAARPGSLGLISQSGALVTAMLDWADRRDIGFSGVVSMGDMADVDLGDMIDLFAVDPATQAILLYVEGVTDAVKFLSAARAAAVVKPVIAIKAGRSAEAAKAARSHTGALAGAYDVNRAAFERAGIVVVETLTELFDAAQVLCRPSAIRGDRLGIVTNGGGAGILAVDALPALRGRLAPLQPATIAALDGALPEGWSSANPVDIRGDASPDHYRAAIRAVLDDETVDALLVMNCPTGTADPTAVVDAVAAEIASGGRKQKPVLGCWLGDANMDAARVGGLGAAIPVFATPDEAVRGFGYLLAARRARAALTDGPAETREAPRDLAGARRLVDRARAERRTMLTESEALRLLAAFGVPVVAHRFVESAQGIDEACRALRPPFALKIVSPELTHKSDAGGVALGLETAEAAGAAACAMDARIRRDHPEATILGFTVAEMVARPHAEEVFAGIATDPTFGPVLMVGAGGTAIEIDADKALDLPPIDLAQAHALIAQTRIARRLRGYRNVPAADLAALAGVLTALSAMTIDLPDIVELDVNPLLIDADGIVALDARIRIAPEPQTASRVAIRPAPMHWAAELETRSGLKVFVRPVRADDEPQLAAFFERVSPEDLRFRFHSGITKVDHERLAMMTRVDYRRTITFLAFDEARKAVIAVAMLAADPDRTRAEVALTTRADLKDKDLSWTLFEHVLRYAAAERIGAVETLEFADNDAALRMEREMGFTAATVPGDATLRLLRRQVTPERV